MTGPIFAIMVTRLVFWFGLAALMWWGLDAGCPSYNDAFIEVLTGKARECQP